MGCGTRTWDPKRFGLMRSFAAESREGKRNNLGNEMEPPPLRGWHIMSRLLARQRNLEQVSFTSWQSSSVWGLSGSGTQEVSVGVDALLQR